jgi:hypothetical protein
VGREEAEFSRFNDLDVLCNENLNVITNISLSSTISSTFLSDDKHQFKINRMTTLAKALMPDDWVTDIEIVDIITSAYQAADLQYGYEEANAWADGFTFPLEVSWEDTIKLGEFDWDLQKLAEFKNNLLI